MKRRSMQRAPAHLAKILDFDVGLDHGAYTFTHGGVHLWSQVRAYLGVRLYDILSNTDFEGASASGATPTLKYVADSWRRRHGASGAGGRSDVIIFGSAVGNIAQAPTGEQFNWLTDYAACSLDCRTQIVELSDRWRYPWPRAYPDVSTFHDWVQLQAKLRQRLHGVEPRDQRTIERFLLALRDAFGEYLTDADFSSMRHTLMTVARRAGIWMRLYDCYFQRRQPRLVQIEGACYGGAWPFVMRSARAAGAVVAEFQHGYIGRDHYAYNYAPALMASSFCEDLPDYFLAYGSYWARQISISSQIEVVGSPRMAEGKAKLASVRPGADILLASTGLGVEVYTATVDALLRSMPEAGSVVFRPHPSERAVAATRYQALLSRPRVRLDDTPDVYRSIAQSMLVVGDLSTLMYEALGLGRSVRIIDTEATRERMSADLFQFLDDRTIAGEIVALMAAPHGCGATQLASESIWASDWKARYRAFVGRFL
ncbi:hypothetical protein AL490_022880 [Achromobacter xylosoxidans]|nr:hypothetical protein AL490_022880 [Achromobacter xylosoxidans]